ncbi:MAG: hypothetical protein ISR59_07675 [Anaerolineales bacterium]|uniref:Uncharacterized protein n=1 Tax=Candidatus Desulfolinea nitratireducens TaxID=2841698 RepID=A0A8J6TIL8_9CHLR|nr:hypothetical protein [Candidatus Desulfolinea nitratireducens]MBL6960974.1 hypothetical protein [Anaerolineales bacterium]
MKRLEKRIESAKEQVDTLEKTLSGALKPVHPPADVIQRLKNRIGSLEPYHIAKRLTNWELWIITVGSVMSVAMVILTIARAIYYFFGRQRGSTA